VVAALGIVTPLSWGSPAAAVTNSVHVAFAGKLAINGMTPVVIDGIKGTATGTVDDAGNLTLPKGSISFPPFHALLAGAVDTVITLQPTDTWTGTIDQHSGAVNIHAPQTAHLDLSSVFTVDTDCPIGPLPLNLTTGTSGTAHGTPLSPNSGAAEIVDGTFAIPAFPTSPPPAACGDADALNMLAGLPLAGGVSVADLTATFTPKQPVPPAPPGAPKALADTATTNENTAVTIDVLANDTPGAAGLPINPSSLKVSKPPANGTATVNADHTITYTPNMGFHGLDFFTYELCSEPAPTTTTTSTTTAPAAARAAVLAVRAAATVAPECSHATVTVTVVALTPVTTAAVTTTTVAVAAAAELPRTGTTSAPIVAIGLALMVGGLAAVGFAKARRRLHS
jgi:LPXTG-motif cell wall-anchored protein